MQTLTNHDVTANECARCGNTHDLRTYPVGSQYATICGVCSRWILRPLAEYGRRKNGKAHLYRSDQLACNGDGATFRDRLTTDPGKATCKVCKEAIWQQAHGTAKATAVANGGASPEIYATIAS